MTYVDTAAIKTKSVCVFVRTDQLFMTYVGTAAMKTTSVWFVRTDQ